MGERSDYQGKQNEHRRYRRGIKGWATGRWRYGVACYSCRPVSVINAPVFVMVVNVVCSRGRCGSAFFFCTDRPIDLSAAILIPHSHLTTHDDELLSAVGECGVCGVCARGGCIVVPLLRCSYRE